LFFYKSIQNTLMYKWAKCGIQRFSNPTDLDWIFTFCGEVNLTIKISKFLKMNYVTKC